MIAINERRKNAAGVEFSNGDRPNYKLEKTSL
jgi:hypothetical protein